MKIIDVRKSQFLQLLDKQIHKQINYELDMKIWCLISENVAKGMVIHRSDIMRTILVTLHDI
jgi:hypothetical protein